MLLFASEQPEAQGLAALGLNWQMILFQAITFLLIVLFLKKFVVNKILAIIDERQKEINSGLDAAQETKDELAKAQQTIDKMLDKARKDAELIVSGAKSESSDIVKDAEAKASRRADAIVAEAESKLNSDVTKVRQQLKEEAAKLVRDVSVAVLGKKIDSADDDKLITNALEASSDNKN